MTDLEKTSAERRGRNVNHELELAPKDSGRDSYGNHLARLDMVEPTYKGGAADPSQDDTAEILDRMNQEAEQARRNRETKAQK